MKSIAMCVTCIFCYIFAATSVQAATFEGEAGLPALEVTDQLTSAAEIRAEEESVKWSHERPDGTQFYTVDEENVYGENLAEVHDLTYDELVGDMWMNSASHRANIMGSYTKVGVGTYASVSGGAYVAMMFG